MTGSDLWAALDPVIGAIEDLGVRYYVGGSVASSAHGVPRSSIDADVVAELEPPHVPAFLSRLGDRYYANETRAADAVRRRRSFIHLATMFKVDLFVIARSTARCSPAPGRMRSRRRPVHSAWRARRTPCS